MLHLTYMTSKKTFIKAKATLSEKWKCCTFSKSWKLSQFYLLILAPISTFYFYDAKTCPKIQQWRERIKYFLPKSFPNLSTGRGSHAILQRQRVPIQLWNENLSRKTTFPFSLKRRVQLRFMMRGLTCNEKWPYHTFSIEKRIRPGSIPSRKTNNFIGFLTIKSKLFELLHESLDIFHSFIF